MDSLEPPWIRDTWSSEVHESLEWFECESSCKLWEARLNDKPWHARTVWKISLTNTIMLLIINLFSIGRHSKHDESQQFAYWAGSLEHLRSIVNHRDFSILGFLSVGPSCNRGFNSRSVFSPKLTSFRYAVTHQLTTNVGHCKFGMRRDNG